MPSNSKCLVELILDTEMTQIITQTNVLNESNIVGTTFNP